MNDKYPLALEEGTILAGQYIIQKVLGQGGFGITYMALDHQNGQKVAIKEFFPDTLASRTGNTVSSYPGERTDSFQYGKTCFLQEAETLAAFIGNENIVKIHSYFEENGTAYFVMDFVEGISFDEYIRQKGGRISYEEAERILIHIIDALALVHSKGIVHRDVTPDNIYITSDGTVKLLDFGAARYSLGDKSRSLDVVLKHGFAPKEQYTRHGRQGPFTDVYTVGASFYFAVTGKRPPDSIDRLEEDDLVPPSSLGVDIPPQKEDAILKAMSVQPGDRFQSMGEFKRALMAAGPVPGASAPTGVTNQIFFTAPQPATGQAAGQTMNEQPAPQPAAAQAAPQPAAAQAAPQPAAPAGIAQRKKMYLIAGAAAAVLLIGIISIFALRGRGNDAPAFAGNSGSGEDAGGAVQIPGTPSGGGGLPVQTPGDPSGSGEEPAQTPGGTAGTADQTNSPYEELLGNTSDNLKNRAMLVRTGDGYAFWNHYSLYNSEGIKLDDGGNPSCLNYEEAGQALYYVNSMDDSIYGLPIGNPGSSAPQLVAAPGEKERFFSVYLTNSCLFAGGTRSDRGGVDRFLARWFWGSDGSRETLPLSSVSAVAFLKGYLFYVGTDNALYRVPSAGDWSSPERLGGYPEEAVVEELCTDGSDLYISFNMPPASDGSDAAGTDSNGRVHWLDQIDPDSGEKRNGVFWNVDQSLQYSFQDLVACNGSIYYIETGRDASGVRLQNICRVDNLDSITTILDASRIGDGGLGSIASLSITDNTIVFYASWGSVDSVFTMSLDGSSLQALDDLY